VARLISAKRAKTRSAAKVLPTIGIDTLELGLL